jgi:hypothetical protein
LVISLITSYDDRAGTSISIGRPFLDNSSVAVDARVVREVCLDDVDLGK